MSSAFHQLLDATVRHLQDLKGRGVRYVNITPAALAALSAPPAPIARPPGRPPAAPALAPPTAADGAPPSPSPRPRAPSATPGGPSAPPAARGPAAGAPRLTPVQVAPPALTDPGGKTAAMAQLRAQALACLNCPHLARSRRNVVFGVGDPHAALLFVGEAPGADEDAQGEPFVGAAGQLLTRIIQTMGLSRQTVYIANILKCRPDTPAQSAGNRPPTEEEMEACLPYLLAQIQVIQPKVIVALGATAVKGLLHSKVGISRLRGQWQDFRGIPAMPTFHPAYLLRNQALSEKRRVWEDMLQVMEKLGLPISDKQRGYFLKG